MQCICFYIVFFDIFYYVIVTRSMLLSVLGGLVVGAAMWAYHKAHLPRLTEDERPQTSPTERMIAAVLADYGGLEV